MKGSSYRERDYAFGQLILTLRTKLELTQTELAEVLGVGRRAVIDWEGGLTYPTTDHLKQFVVLAIQRQAFHAGREAEEIRALWQASHQKVLFDEMWLGRLLPDAGSAPASKQVEEIAVTAHALASLSGGGPRVDWGDAPDVASFYGREWELDLLSEWVVQERCRVVSVLGQGGIGKSALATQVMHRVAQVFDNLESFLQEGEDSGRVRVGYEGFARVLWRVAQTEHQSCWLLTSREKPADLVPLEGNKSPVRTLRLAQLDARACQQLLAEKGVAGSVAEQLRLIEVYAGNPLALKIVAQTIVDLFDGQIAPFLEQGEVVFGGVRALLDEQYARLSAAEQSVLVWLAILREPVTVQELLAVLGTPLPRAQVLEAVESLRRRSLIEPGPRQGSFTLHSVVMEYVTARLIAGVISEIEQGTLSRLTEHGLELASSKDYVRQTQQRLLLAPILAGLRSSYPLRTALEERLFTLLNHLRERADDAQGYGPANLLALLQEQVFTESFDPPWSVATSSHGTSWAMGSRRGGARVWRDSGKMLDLAWQAHTAAVQALACRPDEQMLATGSWDGTIKLWNLENGALLWLGQHTGSIHRLAFTPDGRTLASGGDDAVSRLWDVSTGKLLQTLSSQSSPIYALAWS